MLSSWQNTFLMLIAGGAFGLLYQISNRLDQILGRLDSIADQLLRKNRPDLFDEYDG